MPPHFLLLNDGTLCASIKGMCCHSPLRKDSNPFVGGGPQIDPLQPTCHTAAARRRNSSRSSSSRTVRNIWNEVWQLLGNSQPMHELAAMGQLHTHLQRWCITPPTSQRHDKHKGGVQCLQALYIVATSYHMTYSHQHTHIQLRQIHCTCTRVSLLAPVGRLEASTGRFWCL